MGAGITVGLNFFLDHLLQRAEWQLRALSQKVIGEPAEGKPFSPFCIGYGRVISQLAYFIKHVVVKLLSLAPMHIAPPVFIDRPAEPKPKKNKKNY